MKSPLGDENDDGVVVASPSQLERRFRPLSSSFGTRRSSLSHTQTSHKFVAAAEANTHTRDQNQDQQNVPPQTQEAKTKLKASSIQ